MKTNIHLGVGIFLNGKIHKKMFTVVAFEAKKFNEPMDYLITTTPLPKHTHQVCGLNSDGL